ncbi:RCC1/BLIP-II [Wilcoxina mikolae CBS 423.85]|nr:RCC1/BLIP-II [Wilcoxina mikolae CBS 423.85]
MTEPTACLTSLPDELTLRILHFAGWRSAIKLGETCRKFRNVCEESTFWHKTVMDSFRMRLDNFSQDGNWRQAFKMLTTGKLYGWGKKMNTMFSQVDLGRNGFGRLPGNTSYPKLLDDKQCQGVVDVQSGGWSVSLLTINGSVIIGGSLDGATAISATAPRVLRFPDPETRIRQISSGRSHLLALSSSGKVWSVRGSGGTAEPALIRFVSKDGNLEDSSCKKVVAGWSASGALVEGSGIYLWFDDAQQVNEPSLMSGYDPQYVRMVDINGIPYFSPYAWSSLRPQGKLYKEDPVVDFTIGEGFVIIVTSSGKVFAVAFTDLLDDDVAVAPMELLNFSAPQGQPRIDRVEGRFRKFAVFNKNGLVHIMETDNLESAREVTLAAAGAQVSYLDAMKTDAISPRIIEGLDKYNIVDVAFGDWHCLALTDTGKVLSWGTESQGCGSLGLGPREEAQNRGVQWVPNRDGILNIPQIVNFDHPYSEACTNNEGTAYAYKISAAGWHSCALVAVVEENSTLTAGGISQTGDGASDSKGKNISLPADSSSQTQPDLPKSLPPKTEQGHRGGIVGMRSDARGGESGLAEGTIARGGSSFFGMTGGPLQMGKDDKLSESREKRKKAEGEGGEE